MHDVGYLIFRKHVAFYRQGTVDALNLVDPAQAQTIRLFQPDGKPFDLGRNLCCKVDYRRVERKGRLMKANMAKINRQPTADELEISK